MFKNSRPTRCDRTAEQLPFSRISSRPTCLGDLPYPPFVLTPYSISDSDHSFHYFHITLAPLDSDTPKKMAGREQPYDPYIPSASNGQGGGQYDGGNARTAAIQSVCLISFHHPHGRRLRKSCLLGFLPLSHHNERLLLGHISNIVNIASFHWF